MVRDIGEVRDRSGNVMLKMWQVRVTPGKRILQRHNHTRFEVMTINSGEGTYSTSGGIRAMRPGDVFVFSSSEPHYITEVGEMGLEITNLHFEPRYLGSDNNDTLADVCRMFCFFRASDFENRIQAEQAQKLRSLLFEIRDELEYQPREYSMAVRARLNLLILELIRKFGFATDQSAVAPQINGMMKAMAYIEENLADDLTLTNIACVAGISPNYFSTLFKKMCHVSLWEFITVKRVEKAIHMIVGGSSDTMLEIALACGFNNTANFNKAFKKHTGVTPSHYRSAGNQILH